MESIKAYVDHLQEIDVILSVDKTKSSGVLHTSEVTVWAKGRPHHLKSNYYQFQLSLFHEDSNKQCLHLIRNKYNFF